MGIWVPWKIPIAYYLVRSAVKHGMLKDLILYVLRILFEAGLDPKIIICDQGTNNQSALKALNVTENIPYFFINDKKIYAFFDVPHLLKSIRNNLIGSSFKKEEKTICYSDIKDTYYIDKKNLKSRALLKITDTHINPNSFQKMRVKFAVQIFSNTMASTIRTCVSTNELFSETALDTADFADFMNRLFDCLNSRSLYSKNIYNCALSDTNCVKQFLITASSYFVDLYKLSKKEKITRPPCFNGFTQTINGVLYFFEDEKKHNISFLLTNRLNQDVIENLFSIFRQKGGYNRNPSSRVIRTSFRSTAIYSLVCTSKGTNCKQNLDTEEDCTIIDVNNQKSSAICSDHAIELSDTESLLSSSSNDLCDNLSKEKEKMDVTLEDCTIVYFAGYLAYICLNNFDCNSCVIQLITDTNINNKDQLFIINKTFSNVKNIKTNGLKSPSKKLVELVTCAIYIFEDKFVKVQHKKNIKFIIMKWFKRNNLIQHWLGENEECAEHKLFILDKLLTCKIFKKCQDHSIITRQSKLTKLKIVSHV